MIDHLSTYGTDFEKSRAFYDAVLAPLGASLQMEMTANWDADFPERRMAAWGPGRPMFWLVETRVEYTPRHFAFTAADRAAVDAFHAAGIAFGATDHGAPGPRPIYHPDYYGGFLLDPDGNNVEAVCHAPPA